MRAIIIDTVAKENKEIDYNGDYKKIYALIDCKKLDVVKVQSGNDGVKVDEEGWTAAK